jgi:hypothetical protein
VEERCLFIATRRLGVAAVFFTKVLQGDSAQILAEQRRTGSELVAHRDSLRSEIARRSGIHE